MQENKTSMGEGILKGLKKIIFNSEPTTAVPETKQADASPVVQSNQPTENKPVSVGNTSQPKEMKLRVYQLLEKMNRPGCDFFEVWNAAVEMGGVTGANIKAAYTSLRFADPSLNRSKLDETGNFYMTELRKILDVETAKRNEEKLRLEKEKEQLKSNLTDEIGKLENEIAALKERLEKKKTERQFIDENYRPQLSNIEDKIREGGVSVNAVLAEMMEVKQIIQQVIN